MAKTIFEDLEPNRVIFHYNKKHNEDVTIPTWIIKHKGETYYVNHLNSQVGFRTKETPDSEHTKGALQFKGKLRIVEDETGTEAQIF